MSVIACHQIAPIIANLEANVTLTTRTVQQSVNAGADIIVLPELALSGYMFKSTAEARTVAITANHPVFAEWSRLVKRVNGVVIGGFAEQGEDGLLYNSAAVVDGSGILAVYRKTHLWDKEKLFFAPGTSVPPVVDTPQGRLGLLICYDLEFPEMTRTVALHGADLIVVPTNWAREAVPKGERAGVIIKAMAAANTNHVAIACCDRSGLERGQEWNEMATIINEKGWIVATADEHGVTTADLDLRLARDKTLTQLCDAFGDRRPELYGSISASRPIPTARSTTAM
ncbi:nitrilase-related carbon-nitrogen hydrolase [Pseudarthrobacter sp. YAF2]|uniref:nitrilase-related carbon-nitrogen hydrolase n=1 Tax=Pseudarthrobacter sp. YAF2 TaxID=3233078 RepID=UPI003F9C9B08